MATPLDGGGVAVLMNSANKLDSSSALNCGLKCSKLESPILIFSISFINTTPMLKMRFFLCLLRSSLEEQASLVWQFLCSIPVIVMAEFLPWLSTSISADESQDWRDFLVKIVPGERLLQKVVFTWMEGRNSVNTIQSSEDHSQVQCCSSPLTHQAGRVNCVSESTTTGKRKHSGSILDVSDATGIHPIDERYCSGIMQ